MAGVSAPRQPGTTPHSDDLRLAAERLRGRAEWARHLVGLPIEDQIADVLEDVAVQVDAVGMTLRSDAMVRSVCERTITAFGSASALADRFNAEYDALGEE